MQTTNVSELAALLSETDLFAGQDAAVLQEFAGKAERVYVAPGEYLMREGETGDRFYVLVSGRLRVQVKQADGTDANVGEVGRNEVVGEMALIADEPRSATVIAIRDSELLMFTREDFENLVANHPMAILKIARRIVARLKQSIRSQSAARRELSIVILPAGEHGPADFFTDELVNSLGQTGSVLVLDSRAVDQQLDPGTANSSQHGAQHDRLLTWLNQQEARHRFIVYRPDSTLTNWTRRCLRLADRVLAVGRAHSNPRRNAIEEEFLQPDSEKIFAEAELVLVHEDDGTRPAGTGDWLALRAVRGCHHVRSGRKEDFERLGRFLTGRAFGLVLGGGGARGLSHVGVIRALHELGIPIDAIGGTSMGSIIAGVYAMDSDLESLKELCRASFVKERRLVDFTFPAVALASGKRIASHLEEVFGNVHIEDLWRKYYCVSSNLTRAEMNVHRDGSCWQRIRASISLPGILPPVYDDGDLLVDGGVTNNLPVDIMRGTCDGGTVIAVDVRPKVDMRQKESFDKAISGWQVLRRGMNPFADSMEVPTIANVLMRTALLGSSSAQAANARDADFCLYPPVAHAGLLDFHAFDDLVEIGYQHAKEELQKWWDESGSRRALFEFEN